MSNQHLAQLLALFPAPKSKKFSSEWWRQAYEEVYQNLANLNEAERRSIYDSAQEQHVQRDLPGYSHLNLRFFLHPTFDVFEAFWRDESLREYFTEYLRILVRQNVYSSPTGRKFKKQMEQLKTAKFAKRYVDLLLSRYKLFSLRGEKNPTTLIWLMTEYCSPSHESAWQVFEKEEKRAADITKHWFGGRLNHLHCCLHQYADLFQWDSQCSLPSIDPNLQADDLMSAFEVSDFVLEIPKGVRPIKDLCHIISGILKRGHWPCFKIRTEPLEARVSRATKVLHEPSMSLLSELEEAYFGRLKQVRGVQHGLLPIGLKIHCAATKVPGVDFLRTGMFSAHNAGTCFNIPPMGSMRIVTEFFRQLEFRSGVDFLDSENFQIQVCSPGRLSARNAALLGIAFYLGSDRLRVYHPGDFVTTHSGRTGDRLIIYGAGQMDNKFEWWEERNGAISKSLMMPLIMANYRTDVLGCQSLRDIANVNLVATLLIHVQYQGYWQLLGRKFIAEMESLLENHCLSHLLKVSWLKEREYYSDINVSDDDLFYQALEELSTYAFQEAERIARAREQENWTETRNGILFQVQDLLDDFRSEIEFQSNKEQA